MRQPFIYIKESLENNRIRRWNKQIVKVFISQITNPKYQNQQQEYNSLIKIGIEQWNKILKHKLKFVITNELSEADIIVKFPRVTRQYWGFCTYDNVINSEIKKITIKIGLSNEYYGSELTRNDKILIIIHEFGHALGLGHTVIPSIMCPEYYPEKDWISIDDVITATILYELPIGAYYDSIEENINSLYQKYIRKYNETTEPVNTNAKNLENSLSELSNLNLYKMELNNITIPQHYKQILNKQLLENYNSDTNTKNDK